MKYSKINLALLFFTSLLLCSKSFSHPVSFKGSKGLMGYQSPFVSHNQLNYSFKHWFAAGIHHIQRPNMNSRSATFASANFLLKRWNGKGLQANIYSVIGAGHSELGPDARTSGFGLVQFDIENRDYYFLVKHQLVANSERTDFSQSVVRLGISPYVESYDGIHSWLILEWQSSNFFDGEDLTDLTPFLRIFYKNLLFEIGQSFDGITKFNYITHF